MCCMTFLVQRKARRNPSTALLSAWASLYEHNVQLFDSTYDAVEFSQSMYTWYSDWVCITY